MRLCFVLITVTLVRSSTVTNNDGNDRSGSDESLTYVPHIETTLDFRGLVRKLFVLELGLTSDDDNIICSPISALMPLAKLVYGAKKKSKTETELLDAIGLKRRNEVKYEYHTIIKELEFLKGVDISLVSRLYVSNRFTLMPKYASKAQSVFGSGIEIMDFSKPSDAVYNINTWITEHTANKIKDVMSENDISPMVSLVLANAIHFKGDWEHPFNPPRKEMFFSPRGNTRADMMTRKGSFNYVRCDDLNAQVVEIPYRGEECAMVIVLPYAKNGLSILLRTLKLSPGILHEAMMKMKPALVDVTIPKFKIETRVNLLQYYEKMGIKHTLDSDNSDLTEIVQGEKLYIASAVHKAYIEVTENGTVAAAASVIKGLGASYGAVFKAKQPFLFYIVTANNKEQLFAGIVNSPKW